MSPGPQIKRAPFSTLEHATQQPLAQQPWTSVEVTQTVLRAPGTGLDHRGRGGVSPITAPQRGIGSKTHALPSPEMEKDQGNPTEAQNLHFCCGFQKV